MWDVPIGRDGGGGEDKPSHSANAKTGRLSDLNLTQSELECIQVLLKYLTLLHIGFQIIGPNRFSIMKTSPTMETGEYQQMICKPCCYLVLFCW